MQFNCTHDVLFAGIDREIDKLKAGKFGIGSQFPFPLRICVTVGPSKQRRSKMFSFFEKWFPIKC